MKKKSFVILAILLVALAVLAGCGAESNSDNPDVRIKKVKVNIPEVFHTEESMGKDVYVTKDYPADGSRLAISSGPKTGDFDNLTEERLLEIFTKEVAKDDENVKVEMVEFKKYEIDGFKAIRAKVKFTYPDTTRMAAQLFIDGDKTYSYTFVNSEGENWILEIDEMFDNISIEYEE